MKGVLYISFLVCILLGCSDSDGLPDGEKDKTARTELEIVSASIVELFSHSLPFTYTFPARNNSRQSLLDLLYTLEMTASTRGLAT